jgi:hypothetical protein
MAYLTSYEYDIFISYAHADNKRKWVDNFCKYLKDLLAIPYGDNIIKIWKDETLTSNQLFNKEIPNALNKSALFISLLSNNYLKSKYCLKELEWFCQHVKNKGESLSYGKNYSRVIHLLMADISKHRWPVEFQGKLGVPFYDENYMNFPLQPDEKRFDTACKKLCSAIAKILEAMKNNEQNLSVDQSDPTNESQHSIEAHPQKVFLASTSDSLKHYVKRMRKVFHEKNIYVFDSIPPPYNADEHEKKARHNIKESTLCLHLLNEYDGEEIDGDSTFQTYPLKQLDIAEEEKKDPKDQLIWLPKKLDYSLIDSDTYQDRLIKLENDDRVIRTNTTEMSEISKIVIKELEARKKSKEKIITNTSYFVDTHINDLLLATSLHNHLVQHQFLSYFSARNDESDPLKQFDNCLSKANTLLIVYGKVNVKWVIARLFEAMKIITIQEYPVHKTIVFMLPPQKKTTELKEKLKFFKNIQMINNSNSEDILPDNFQKIITSNQQGMPS